MNRTILLTGFTPFGTHLINPSELIVQHLQGSRIDNFCIVGQVLPVVLQSLAEQIQQLLFEHQPSAVLSLGLAANTGMIRLERLAVNCADFELPDNAGLQCRNQPLFAGGVAGLRSTLKFTEIQQVLLAQDFATELSDDAGRYLCNAALYYFLQYSTVPCGFVHLPPLDHSNWTLQRQINAVQIMLDQMRKAHL